MRPKVSLRADRSGSLLSGWRCSRGLGRAASTLALSLWLGLCVSGCNQQPPPDADGDASEDSKTPGSQDDDSQDSSGSDPSEDSGSTNVDPVDEMQSHYPLVVGAKWVYVSLDASGEALGEEEVVAKADEDAPSGVHQILLEDNEDEEGNRTQSRIRRIKTGAYRVHKEVLQGDKVQESVTYDPGFVRFDEAWLELDVGDSVEYTYERATSSEEDTRAHRYEMLGKNVEVEVPAGEFTCVHIARTRLTGAAKGEKVEYWFAPGVGKVRELRLESGKEERLERFTIPSLPR